MRAPQLPSGACTVMSSSRTGAVQGAPGGGPDAAAWPQGRIAAFCGVARLPRASPSAHLAGRTEEGRRTSWTSGPRTSIRTRGSDGTSPPRSCGSSRSRARTSAGAWSAVSRSHRQRRKGTSLAVGAAMLAAPVVPAFAGSRGASRGAAARGSTRRPSGRRRRADAAAALRRRRAGGGGDPGAGRRRRRTGSSGRSRAGRSSASSARTGWQRAAWSTRARGRRSSTHACCSTTTRRVESRRRRSRPSERRCGSWSTGGGMPTAGARRTAPVARAAGECAGAGGVAVPDRRHPRPRPRAARRRSSSRLRRRAAARTAGSSRRSRARTMTGRYGESRPGHTHAGEDLAVAAGTPIHAAQCGTVVQSGAEQGYGLMVCVRHAGGVDHLLRPHVATRRRP